MKNYTDRIYNEMASQLNELNVNGGTQSEHLKESIKVCKKAMTKLKKFISGYAFDTDNEEMTFFKEIKPLFYSKYIYFINVYNFLMQFPAGGEEAVLNYINFQLSDLQRFFDNNKAFYQYYRSGSSQLDQVYFTRGGYRLVRMIDLIDFLIV